MRIDKITNSLCLGKLHATVAYSAKREFSRLGHARIERESDIDDRPQQYGRSVTVQLDDILSGERVRCPEKANERFIECFAAFRIDQCFQAQDIGFRVK